MADRYLYDRFGRLLGVSSDQPPDPGHGFRAAGGCLLVLLGVAALIAAIRILVAFVHPAVDHTPHLLGRWQDEASQTIVQYAPDHTYMVTRTKDGQPVETGAWRLDEMTLFYTVQTPRTTRPKWFRVLRSLDGDTLVWADPRDFGSMTWRKVH